MIGADRLATFLAVVVVLIAVPGPSVVFMVSRGVALGRRAALPTALGNEAGLVVQLVLVALGLGSIVERSQVVLSLVKFAGALYLVYLGVQTWRHRRDLAGELDSGRHAPAGFGRIFRDGFLVGVSNPKGLLIFTAILPQFVDPALGRIPLQLLMLGMICIGIALVSDVSWGLFAGSARTWLGKSARRLEIMSGASGVILIGLGAQLALSSND
ncbi:LysE family translocator [Microbispora amethystogenes]|uniref:LysE family translocator n=1 Tax=Microbispora amethystogenes TaxID=1427754 RepID=UPI0033D12FE6